MANARAAALSALIACRKQGAWSDGALRELIARDGLDRRDAAFAARLCYGVLQNRMLLDDRISCVLTGKLRALQPVVLDILRLGAYQILFLDRVPASAAVNEAVEQTKRSANRRAAGLVNGVLRALDRKKDTLPKPESLSVRYSHPGPLVKLLRESLGEDSLALFLAADNSIPGTMLQRNPLRAQKQEIERALEAAGADFRPHPWLDDCWIVSGMGDLEALPVFRSGGVYVQDAAARLAVLAADPRPGMRVLDACAAPGGKSFAAAMQMENSGSILSCDIHPHKLTLMEAGARRLGVSILETRLHDASKSDESLLDSMDVVLADVPCSGLGVIRKKPDIRYKDLTQTQALPPLQLAILRTVSRYVRPGGVLLYSTCTVLRRENEDVCRAFLAETPTFHPEPFAVPDRLALPNDGMATLLPHLHEADGFFICKLRRDP